MISKRFALPFFFIPWFIAAACFGWLLIKRFPPSGTVSFDIPFDGTSAWMDPFLPAERTTSPGEQEGGWRGQRVIQDPVYTAARVPGVYDSVDVIIEFRPIRQPLVEFGILRDDATLAFDFEPLWYEPLASEEWRFVDAGARSGFVRDGVADDLLGSSNYQALMLWHASATPIVMRDEPGDEIQTDVSLRGAHDLWMLPAGDELDVTIAFQDSNRRQGRDTIVINVLDGDTVLQTEAFGIGGSLDTSMGTVVSKRMQMTDLDPGVYRVQVVMDDDIFIRSVRTPTRRWVVGPRLSFGDLVGYKEDAEPGIAWSNSRHLVLETFHNEGLQTASFGEDTVAVSRTHDQFRLDRTDDDPLPKKLVAPNGDIRVIGDGFFAFRPDAFFVPEPRRVTAWSNPVEEGIDGIVTSYRPPEVLEDDWLRTKIQFTLDPTRDHSRFALSTPGIEAWAGAVDIRRVTLTYRRPPLSWSEWWRVLRQELVNAYHRLQ